MRTLIDAPDNRGNYDHERADSGDGTDRNYAAALDWIKQAAASGKTLSPPQDGEPATEELVAALLPVITSQHATAIVAQQIRETLSAPRPAPAQGLRPLITARSGTPAPTRPGVPTATTRPAQRQKRANCWGAGPSEHHRCSPACS